MNREQLEKFLPFIIAGVIILLGGTGFFLYKYQSGKTLGAATGQTSDQEEINKVVTEVGKLLDLPQGETPTLATVTDISKLQGQAFFAKAQNGDKVLIYAQAKKAILYNPNQKKIIEVAPVNIGSDSAQENTQARIVLRNGAGSTGLTAKIEPEIKKAFADANIVARENAGRSTYERSIVIYLNEQAKAAGESLSQTLNASISATMPVGEQKPENADIVVILGKDKI